MARNLWDFMARSYDKKFESSYFKIFEILTPRFSPFDEIIEIGCGSGLVSFKIIPNVQRFVGFDLSKEMIHVAQTKLAKTSFTNATFLIGDVLNLPTMEQFDKVLLINILHILDDPLKALTQVKTLLKPDGQIFVISYCHGESMNVKNKIGSLLMRLGSAVGIMGKLHTIYFCRSSFTCRTSRIQDY